MAARHKKKYKSSSYCLVSDASRQWHGQRHGQRLNICLRRLGVKKAIFRRIIIRQIFFAIIILAAGIIIFPLTEFVLWLAVGILSGIPAFMDLTIKIPRLIVTQYSAARWLLLFIHSQLRIILSGAALALCHIFFGASVWALLGGFSLSLILIAWGVFGEISRAGRHRH